MLTCALAYAGGILTVLAVGGLVWWELHRGTVAREEAGRDTS